MSATPDRQTARASTPSSRSVTGASVRKTRNKGVACRKCHARKVRCSGGLPCTNCRQANCTSECVYPTRDRQVKVSESYIEQLLRENQRLRDDNATVPVPVGNTAGPISTGNVDILRSSTENGDSVRNPLLEDRPWFFPLKSSEMPILIGEAADAAFATRFRQALSDTSHSHIPRTHYITDETLASLSEANCPWPSPTRAKFLVKVALNTICRCYYVVRKSSILEGLEKALSNPTACDSLFASKLWALFALGEAYSSRAASDTSFPGLLYFSHASRMLRILSERPRIECIEITLLLSLYSLCMNRRHSAYCMAGSAVRFGLVMGLHLNVPELQMRDRETREHRNRLWWTAYVIDRFWASKLGQPVSIHDDDIDVDLPSNEGLSVRDDGQSSSEDSTGDFADPEYYIASVKLARLAGRITASIYGRRMQQSSFSQRVQQALRDLRSWVQDLPDHLHISTDEAAPNTAMPIVALHLSFNQCMILATRPILLHVFRMRRESWAASPDRQPLQIPETALALSEACIRCARHSYRLLTESWVDGSFATFDYFYTQYLFSASTILAISSLSNNNESQSDGDDFEAASQFLHQLKQNGNFAGKEFYQHIEAIKDTMRATAPLSKINMSNPNIRNTDVPTLPAIPGAIPGAPVPYTGSMVTAGMALAEPSLQELLSQPDLDLRFLETSIIDDGFQTFYWPEPRGEGWMGG